MNERRYLTEKCAESEVLKAKLLDLQSKFGILSEMRNDTQLLKDSLSELSKGILNQSNALFQDFIANYQNITKELIEVIVYNFRIF